MQIYSACAVYSEISGSRDIHANVATTKFQFTRGSPPLLLLLPPQTPSSGTKEMTRVFRRRYSNKLRARGHYEVRTVNQTAK